MFLAKSKWYRSLRGGIWYFISPQHLCPYINPFWTKNNLKCEKILKVERYGGNITIRCENCGVEHDVESFDFDTQCTCGGLYEYVE